jgi:hypothetical protein
VTGAQLALDLGHRPAFGRDDFLVSTANHAAVEWIDLFPNWPSHALAIVGSAGSGKTHLAHVFAARTGAEVWPFARLQGADIGALVAQRTAFVLEHDDAPFARATCCTFSTPSKSAAGICSSRRANRRRAGQVSCRICNHACRRCPWSASTIPTMRCWKP